MDDIITGVIIVVVIYAVCLLVGLHLHRHGTKSIKRWIKYNLSWSRIHYKKDVKSIKNTIKEFTNEEEGEEKIRTI